DLADRLAVDDDGDVLAGVEVHARLVAGRVRAGIDLDPTIHQVDDPVDGDAAAGIRGELLALVVGQAGLVGDFDDQGDVAGLRLLDIVTRTAPHDRDVRLRHAGAARVVDRVFAGDEICLGRDDARQGR